MTKEELLELGIYCSDKIDLTIIVYLNLGFKVLFRVRDSCGFWNYILLYRDLCNKTYIPFEQIITEKAICKSRDIYNVNTLKSRYYIYFNYTRANSIGIGDNQIEDIKLYINSYGNKN